MANCDLISIAIILLKHQNFAITIIFIEMLSKLLKPTVHESNRLRIRKLRRLIGLQIIHTSSNLFLKNSFLENPKLSPDFGILRGQLGVLRGQVGPRRRRGPGVVTGIHSWTLGWSRMLKKVLGKLAVNKYEKFDLYLMWLNYLICLALWIKLRS